MEKAREWLAALSLGKRGKYSPDDFLHHSSRQFFRSKSTRTAPSTFGKNISNQEKARVQETYPVGKKCRRKGETVAHWQEILAYNQAINQKNSLLVCCPALCHCPKFEPRDLEQFRSTLKPFQIKGIPKSLAFVSFFFPSFRILCHFCGVVYWFIAWLLLYFTCNLSPSFGNFHRLQSKRTGPAQIFFDANKRYNSTATMELLFNNFRNISLPLLWSLLGTDHEKPLLDLMAYIMIALGVVVYVALSIMPAPYGMALFTVRDWLIDWLSRFLWLSGFVFRSICYRSCRPTDWLEIGMDRPGSAVTHYSFAGVFFDG